MIADIIITAVILAIVAAIIINQIRRKKKGQSSCGCSNCSMSDMCHKKK
ncbi:MAG: FeoB-associated Cys-rich membrane protein [Hominilimicola sp.]